MFLSLVFVWFTCLLVGVRCWSHLYHRILAVVVILLWSWVIFCLAYKCNILLVYFHFNEYVVFFFLCLLISFEVFIICFFLVRCLNVYTCLLLWSTCCFDCLPWIDVHLYDKVCFLDEAERWNLLHNSVSQCHLLGNWVHLYWELLMRSVS